MELLNDEVLAAVKHVEDLMNCKFGDPANPLLVSVRSGARASMPGMMDTILNLGLNDTVAEGMTKKTNNPTSFTTPTAASYRCTAMWCSV